MSTYYHGVVGLYGANVVKRHKYGKFYTTKIAEAKIQGPIVEKVDIVPSNPLYIHGANKIGLGSLAKKWGLFKKWIILYKNNYSASEDLLFKDAIRRGYDVIVAGDWCVVLNDSAIKNKKILRFDYKLSDFIGASNKYARNRKNESVIHKLQTRVATQ